MNQLSGSPLHLSCRRSHGWPGRAWVLEAPGKRRASESRANSKNHNLFLQRTPGGSISCLPDVLGVWSDATWEVGVGEAGVVGGRCRSGVVAPQLAILAIRGLLLLHPETWRPGRRYSSVLGGDELELAVLRPGISTAYKVGPRY